jgi:hypothetical protein
VSIVGGDDGGWSKSFSSRLGALHLSLTRRMGDIVPIGNRLRTTGGRLIVGSQTTVANEGGQGSSANAENGMREGGGGAGELVERVCMHQNKPRVTSFGSGPGGTVLVLSRDRLSVPRETAGLGSP